jgi:hypothetical protein
MSENKTPKFADLTMVLLKIRFFWDVMLCVWLFPKDRVSHLRRPESSNTVPSTLSVDQISPFCVTWACCVLLHVPVPRCQKWKDLKHSLHKWSKLNCNQIKIKIINTYHIMLDAAILLFSWPETCKNLAGWWMTTCLETWIFGTNCVLLGGKILYLLVIVLLFKKQLC